MINDRQRIDHILEAIGKIIEATSCAREEFLSSFLKRDAVLYNFLVLGEAANQLSPELQLAHPEIPWKVIVGMRNVLIHDYVQTNYDLVWKTAKEDIPKLQEQIRSIQEKIVS